MNRRHFLLAPALASTAAAATPGTARSAPRTPPAWTPPELAREPDLVAVYRNGERLVLDRSGERWTARDVAVTTAARAGQKIAIALSAPQGPVERIGLRWKGAFPAGFRFLGDHWERSYGDLEWRVVEPHRAMPWYFLASDGRASVGCGVQTGARAIASWQVDGAGVTLWLDVRSGGGGVELGARRLEAATVVVYRAAAGESP
jgi:alpha-galactosidase